MSEHTPRPWIRASDEGGSEREICTAPDAELDSILIARVEYDLRPTNGAKQWNANSNLIAAAPDLLEACKGIVDGFDEWEGPEEDILPPPSDRACCARNRKVRLYEAVQAAILKAEPLDKEAGDVVE